MSDNLVVTIGRQYGSGGHDIGKKLAEKMGVHCYDKELLELAAKNSGLCEDIFNKQDETPSNSFLYSLVMDTYSFGYNDTYNEMPINQRVFLAQYEEIKKLAAMESCVIVGRCADYALEDSKSAIKVFITAPMPVRVARIMERRNINAKKAEALILKTDKKRKSYYDYYSDKKWGEARSYDICIDSSILGEDGTVELIMQYMSLKNKFQNN